MKNQSVILTRRKSYEKQTLGILQLIQDGNVLFECNTLELPWKNNEPNISCIPKGKYKVVRRTSAKYSEHFHITDVPCREWILIHPGNYYSQIRGCILPGSGLHDINGDGILDVTSSKATLKTMLEIFPETFTLEIR